MSTPKKTYDNTVALIAGNLLAGWPIAPAAVTNGGYSAEYEGSLTRPAVRRARAIVAEVERTEPPSPEERAPR